MESNEGKALYTLVKSATTEITFDHKNRVVKAFDGVADWNVVHKDSLQEWKGAFRSVSTSTVTDMCSTLPYRILWHRMNHGVYLCTVCVESNPEQHWGPIIYRRSNPNRGLTQVVGLKYSI